MLRALQCTHCLGSGAGVGQSGGHGTPCSPHIPHLPQDHSWVFQRKRDDPSLLLGLCRSWRRMWMALGGSLIPFPGGFWGPGAGMSGFSLHIPPVLPSPSLCQQWPGGSGALGSHVCGKPKPPSPAPSGRAVPGLPNPGTETFCVHPGYFYPLTAACFLLSCGCFGAALPRRRDGSELVGFGGMSGWLGVVFPVPPFKTKAKGQ